MACFAFSSLSSRDSGYLLQVTITTLKVCARAYTTAFRFKILTQGRKVNMIYCNCCLVSLYSCHSILQIVTGSRDVNITLGITREDILISNSLRQRPIWKIDLLT